MEKKEKETEKRIIVTDVPRKKSLAKYVLNEAAYMAMIREYNGYRKYILDRLEEVERIGCEHVGLFVEEDDTLPSMWSIIQCIRKHRKGEAEVGYYMYEMRNILERVKKEKRGMSFEEFTIIEPWEKSPFREIMNGELEMNCGGFFANCFDGKEPRMFDWRAYTTMLRNFLKYGKRVMESLSRTVFLGRKNLGKDTMLSGCYDEMFDRLLCCWEKICIVDGISCFGLYEMIRLMKERAEEHNPEEDGTFKKLIPASPYYQCAAIW